MPSSYDVIEGTKGPQADQSDPLQTCITFYSTERFCHAIAPECFTVMHDRAT